MAKRTRVAVIGAGYWGQKHVDEFSRLPSAELVAVSDLSEKNRQHCKEKYGVEAYSDYRELLANGGIDAVSICTNNETHFEVASAAMRAGKHALVEKPLTHDLATSKQLLALSRKEKKVLCVGHLFRFNNAVRKLKELHEQKFFGELYFIKIQWTSHNTEVPGRTVLTDLGPHAFDIPSFITGWWPKKSVYFGSQFRRGELEEVAFAESDFGNGFFAYSELSWLLPGKRREVYVVGSKRCAIADCNSQKVVAHEVIRDVVNREGKLKESYEVAVQPNNALAEELASFVSDCQSGKTEGSVNSVEVGLRVNQALLSCKKISPR